jgi:hypothetical protein
MVHDRIAGAQQPGDGLGRIQGAAAADAQDAIETLARACADTLVDEGGRGFAGNLDDLPGDGFLASARPPGLSSEAPPGMIGCR